MVSFRRCFPPQPDHFCTLINKIRTALAFFRAHPQQLEDLAQVRASALLDDHRRVRKAARDVGQYSVSACLPVDLVSVYVLLPDAL